MNWSIRKIGDRPPHISSTIDRVSSAVFAIRLPITITDDDDDDDEHVQQNKKEVRLYP